MTAIADISSNTLQTTPPTINIKILVVDDDCDDSSFIAEAIRHISPGYEVVCIDRADKALDFFNSLSSTELPNLVILDYNMPVLTGVDILKRLKSSESYRHIPIVIYSHSTFPKHKIECLEAGASLYLVKSSSISSLREDVRQMLYYCE